MPTKRNPLTFSIYLVTAALTISSSLVLGAEEQVEEIVVWGTDSDRSFGNLSPTSVLTQDDFTTINVATTEDVVKFE